MHTHPFSGHIFKYQIYLTCRSGRFDTWGKSLNAPMLGLQYTDFRDFIHHLCFYFSQHTSFINSCLLATGIPSVKAV